MREHPQRLMLYITYHQVDNKGCFELLEIDKYAAKLYFLLAIRKKFSYYEVDVSYLLLIYNCVS